MKKLSLFVFCFCILSLGLFLYSCSDKPTEQQPITETLYQIAIDKTENGSISTSKTEAKENDVILIYASPNDNYILDKISISNVSLSQITENIYKFEMPKNNITISASFKAKEQERYNVNVISTGNGQISTKNNSYQEGDDVTVLVTPNTDYQLDLLYSEEVVLNYVASNAYTFKMPAKNVSIFATFKEKSYSILSTYNENASIVLSRTEAQKNDVIYISVFPDKNYHLTSITADLPVSFTKINENLYSFIMPAHDITINVQTTADTPQTIDKIAGSYKVISVDNYGEELISNPYYDMTFVKINPNYTATIATHYGSHISSEDGYSNYYIFENITFTKTNNNFFVTMPEIGDVQAEILNENTMRFEYNSKIYTISKIMADEIENGSYSTADDALFYIDDEKAIYEGEIYYEIYKFGNYIVLGNEFENDRVIMNFTKNGDSIVVDGYQYYYHFNTIGVLDKQTYTKSNISYTLQDITGSYKVTNIQDSDEFDVNLEGLNYGIFVKIKEEGMVTISAEMSEENIDYNFYTLRDLPFSLENNQVNINIENLDSLDNIIFISQSTFLVQLRFSGYIRTYIMERITETPIQNGTYTNENENFIVESDKITYKNVEYTDFVIYENVIIINFSSSNNTMGLFTTTTDENVRVICYEFNLGSQYVGEDTYTLS